MVRWCRAQMRYRSRSGEIAIEKFFNDPKLGKHRKKYFHPRGRGVSKNMAALRTTADILMFSSRGMSVSKILNIAEDALSPPYLDRYCKTAR